MYLAEQNAVSPSETRDHATRAFPGNTALSAPIGATISPMRPAGADFAARRETLNPDRIGHGSVFLTPLAWTNPLSDAAWHTERGARRRRQFGAVTRRQVDRPVYNPDGCVDDHGELVLIKAIYRNGLIYPAEPVPPDWSDGQAVIVETEWAEPSDDPGEIDRWVAEWRAVGPLQYEPGEREHVQAVLAEADRQAKDFVRRRMESGQ